jgi:hypothetical protein
VNNLVKLGPGTRPGAYENRRSAGIGQQGEVFHARDTKLRTNHATGTVPSHRDCLHHVRAHIGVQS